MRYKKTVRTGKFLKPNEDFRENELVTVLNEGVTVDGTYGEEHQFKVRTQKGEEGTLRFNKTTINNLIDAFGDEGKGWVGKEVKVWRILQNVQGKMLKVTYLSHPDAEVDEQGNFVIPGKQSEPSSEKEVPYPEEDIDPENIPF